MAGLVLEAKWLVDFPSNTSRFVLFNLITISLKVYATQIEVWREKAVHPDPLGHLVSQCVFSFRPPVFFFAHPIAVENALDIEGE